MNLVKAKKKKMKTKYKEMENGIEKNPHTENAQAHLLLLFFAHKQF